MSVRLVCFLVIMLAALSLGVGIGHLMELPARMAWDQDLWVGATVQGGFFALSGPLGVLLQVFTIIGLIVLLAVTAVIACAGPKPWRPANAASNSAIWGPWMNSPRALQPATSSSVFGRTRAP